MNKLPQEHQENSDRNSMNEKTIRYAELVDVAKLQTLLESFNQATGIANAVIDVEGVVIASAGWQDVCTKFHRVNAETCKRCVESDTSLVKSMTEGTSYAVYGCMNGLTDTAAPIVVDGQHVANVFTGQFFTAPPDYGFFKRHAEQCGFDESSYFAAIARVPILPVERVESLTRMYAQLAQMLADNGLDRLRQRRASLAMAQASERTLHGCEAQFRRAIETSADGYWMIGMDGRILEVNDAYVRASGYSREELMSMHISDVEAIGSAADTSVGTGRLQRDGYDRFEGRHRAKDGRIWQVEVTASYCTMPQERMFAFIKDITQRKQIEQALQLTQFAMDNAYVEIYWLGKDARIHYANSQACKTLGYTFEELTTLSVPDIDPLFPAAAWEEHWQALLRDKKQNFETLHKRKDGSTFPVDVAANHVQLDGKEYNVAFARDISERKSYEDKLTSQANTDYLTGIANRRHFSELFELELMRSTRYGNPLSLLLLDIDHFKSINDNHGHKTGDIVLQKLAAVSQAALREVDVIGRWGGEEFAILLPETTSAQADEVASRLCCAIAASPITLPDGSALRFTASIGCTSMAAMDDTIDALILQADNALYEAKHTGRNRVCIAVRPEPD